MDLDWFKDLANLAATGNFSRAAQQSNVSQSAFSRRIKTLEAWVGVRLVDRSRQPVRLTEAGEQILEAGTQAISRIEQERSQILETQSLPDKYVVTFGAQHSIGWRFYPAWLQALEEAYGPILSRLRADDLPLCIRALEAGEVDFVIAYQSTTPITGKDFEMLLLGSDQLIPVCKPDVNGHPMFSFDDPNIRMPYLRFGNGAPIGMHLEPLFLSRKLSDRLQTVYENSMAGALRIRARAGDGIAWLPKSLVRPDLENKSLVQTGDPNWVVDLSIQLLRNKERSNRTTRSIWSFLEGEQPTLLPSAG